MRSMYFIAVMCILGFSSCSKGKIEIDLNKDVIKVFEHSQGTKLSEYFSYCIEYFTNHNSLIISGSDAYSEPSYILQVTNKKLILTPYNFPTPEIKQKSRLFEIMIHEAEINRIYGNDNLEKLFTKHEYFSGAVQISDKKVIMRLIYNTNLEPGGLGHRGYLGLYDGKELKRVYLSISNKQITFYEVTSELYYDSENRDLYIPGDYVNIMKRGLEARRLFKYSVKDGSLREIYYGGKYGINSIRRIPNTDYLIFWDDGIVLLRIKDERAGR